MTVIVSKRFKPQALVWWLENPDTYRGSWNGCLESRPGKWMSWIARLTVHEESWIGGRGGPGGEAPEKQSFAIDRRRLEACALRILKLARSALVYFVHAVAIEEETRAAARPARDVIIPTVFPPVDDRSKR
jgi:hypothetical protein